ncbi:hypothetical protein ACFFX0_02230 [Citricoccus parietis]|uniref:Uncharacterized protein n=1 Tax=Citricoccus parietis TaxID=592307 RepID=A0ABV5FTQ8_9MICC
MSRSALSPMRAMRESPRLGRASRRSCPGYCHYSLGGGRVRTVDCNGGPHRT